MSEEEAAEEGGGGGGSVLKKYGPLAAIVLLAQVVLAWVVIQVAIKDNPATEAPTSELLPQEQQQAPTEEGQDSEELPFYYKNEVLDKITANPAGTNAQRFVVVGVELGLIGNNGDGEIMTTEEVMGDAELPKVDANLGLIKSIILDALSSKYIDQIEAERPEIMADLKEELNRRVFNRIAWGDEDDQKSIRISEVIFTTLIIQ